MDINDFDDGGCAARAPFALRVIGTSMEPEFRDGAVIIVDPDHPYGDGAYVVVDYGGETTFRQFTVREGRKYLVALHPDFPDVEITQAYKIRGVVTQQARNRRLGLKRARHYV